MRWTSWCSRLFPIPSEAIRAAIRDIIYQRVDLAMDRVKKLEEAEKTLSAMEVFQDKYLQEIGCKEWDGMHSKLAKDLPHKRKGGGLPSWTIMFLFLNFYHDEYEPCTRTYSSAL